METAAGRTTGAIGPVAHVRSRQARSLTHALRLLWAVLFAPFVLFALAVVTIGQEDDHPVSNRFAVLLYGIAASFLPVAVVLLGMLQAWARHSYNHRFSGTKYRPVVWSDPGWARVRAVFVSAGLDPERLRAVSVWDPKGNLRARHIARPAPGRMGRMNDWTVPRYRVLFAVGGVAGIALAVFQDRISEFTDTAVFTVFLVCAVIAMLPFAWIHGSRQVRLNLRDPDTVVVIPMEWRPRLRRDPKTTVRLLHEISHVRHDDPGKRRVLAICPGVGQCLAFLNVAPVSSLVGNLLVVGVSAIGVVTLGVMSVRRAARLIPLVQELRADAEACGDAETTSHMAEFLQDLQAKHPSEEKRLRLASLADDSLVLPLKRRLIRTTVMAAGYVLPVVVTAVCELAGALTISIQ
ncbi:hypothetical protein ABT124_07165 [Streptomyces sp. NPDC001982]|uniref:hypothetical protein n=1 Tax=Streptomyces sp. NPDC001982 TaxID=3154405 RepID=UPI00332F4D71